MADEPIDVREMITAYRAVARPRPAVKRRIAQAIAAPVPAPRWPYVAVAVAAAAALVASLAWPESWLDRSPREEHRPEAPYDDATPSQLGRVDSPHAPEVARPVAPAPQRVVAPPIAPRETSERKAPARRDAKDEARDRRAAPADVVAAGDDLLAEMALLERARSRLAAGNPRAALALAEEHASTFPGGALTEERDALRVIASCALPDRSAAAFTARLAFARDYPRSTYAERVRRACTDLGGSSAETDIP